MPRYQGVWRKPAQETHGAALYPDLCVHDGRVSGSITTGCTRLPLWCFITTALTEGWQAVENGWSPSKYGWDAWKLATFLYNLLEQRGEFARLICVLADVERREAAHGTVDQPWWEIKSQRNRVLAQLRRCVAVLEGIRDSERD